MLWPITASRLILTLVSMNSFIIAKTYYFFSSTLQSVFNTLNCFLISAGNAGAATHVSFHWGCGLAGGEASCWSSFAVEVGSMSMVLRGAGRTWKLTSVLTIIETLLDDCLRTPAEPTTDCFCPDKCRMRTQQQRLKVTDALIRASAEPMKGPTEMYNLIIYHL